MKIKIKDLEPNPFRDMKNYPINREKIESLANSINQTGFWDNILARKSNGKIQIAYGHHRLVVLQRNFKPDHIINIPIKNLDDATMIRIMANENMEQWITTPAIIDETVKIARDFLLKHPEIRKAFAPRGKGFPPKHGISAREISEFLGKNWNRQRVQYSLERLELIDKGELDKKIIESMPTDRTARKFVSAIKKTGLKDIDAQKRAAERIVKEENFSEEGIKYEVLEEKLGRKEKKEGKEKEFEIFIEECSKLINTLNRKLETLINFKSDFDSKYYKETLVRFFFDASVDTLRVRLKQLLD